MWGLAVYGNIPLLIRPKIMKTAGQKGAPLPSQYSVALLEKGLPFPAKCALSWLVSGTLRVTELTKQPTRGVPQESRL